MPQSYYDPERKNFAVGRKAFQIGRIWRRRSVVDVGFQKHPAESPRSFPVNSAARRLYNTGGFRNDSKAGRFTAWGLADSAGMGFLKTGCHFLRQIAFSIVAVYFFSGCAGSKAEQEEDRYFRTRGLILDVNDLSTVDWPKRAQEAGLTTLATHITPAQVAEFIQSGKGRKFLEACKSYGIEVEHELHAMADLLPRNLFEEDSTMFRMDATGRRVRDYNLCVHSEKALNVVCANAVRFSRILPSTTGRYFYWIDDGQPMCQCPRCAGFTESEQALILENALVKALRREVDPRATLAHLAYQNTMEAPSKVKPEEGIFLEFAPIHRSWKQSLRNTEATGWNESSPVTHGEYLRLLDENLKVFPPETAQVLEYWLDVSLFSRWKKPAAALPWNKEVFLEDIDVYARRGIRNITSFGVYLDGEYMRNHPDVSFIDQYGQGLKNYKAAGR